MKKRNTFLVGLLTLMFSASAVAQDLVIPTNSESGVEIMKDGKFVGLAVDECNESSATEERLDQWISALKIDGAL